MSKSALSRRPVISVTNHALTRARARYRDDKMERDVIRESVRAGIEAGLVHDKKPPAFLLYKQKAHALPPDQRVVVAPDESRAWLVSIDKPGTIVVITSLNRTWSEVAA